MLDRILIVDDETLVLDTLTEVLQREGFQVSKAGDAKRALELLASEPHALMLTDIRMPNMDGMELLARVRALHPGTDVLLMTGFGSLDGAIDAMALGASDYLIKPLKPKEIIARVRSILQRRRLEADLHSLQSELRSRYEMHNLVAQSPRMHALVAALQRVKESSAPIVLCGEEGSGRQFVARSIHYSGPRRGHEFAVLDARIPPAGGVANALFGEHRTDARRRRGLLELHCRGSLLLVGVETLEPTVQRRIADVLRAQLADAGDAKRLADESTCRLIVSLDTPPTEMLAAGRLSSELAELRDVPTLQVPALRQRADDLPGLVAAFVESYSLEHGNNLRLGPRVLELLLSHDLPGNVRQLFAVLTNCAVLSVDGVLSAANVERSLRRSDIGAAKPIADHLGDREYQVVALAVQRNPGRLDQAARELGVSRTTLWRRMRKYGIGLAVL